MKKTIILIIMLCISGSFAANSAYAIPVSLTLESDSWKVTALIDEDEPSFSPTVGYSAYVTNSPATLTYNNMNWQSVSSTYIEVLDNYGWAGVESIGYGTTFANSSNEILNFWYRGTWLEAQHNTLENEFIPTQLNTVGHWNQSSIAYNGVRTTDWFTDVHVTAEAVSVPEPSTMLLMGLGLLGLGFTRRLS